MIKTAEVQVPQTVDTRPVSGRFLLYNAFRNLSECETINPYANWRRDRNNRWIGGLTAVGKVEGFEGVSIATVLRESPGMVQFLAVNANAYQLDRAEDYRKDGWELSDRDPRVLLNAVYLKKGKPEVYVSYRTDSDPVIDSKEVGQFNSEDMAIIIPVMRQIGFERIVAVISKSDSRADAVTQFLISPAWRPYNYMLDGKVPTLGGRSTKDASRKIKDYQIWH